MHYLPTTAHYLPTTAHYLPTTAHCPTTYCSLPYYLLLATTHYCTLPYYLLLTTLLPTAHYHPLLHTTHSLLLTTLLPTVHYYPTYYPNPNPTPNPDHKRNPSRSPFQAPPSAPPLPQRDPSPARRARTILLSRILHCLTFHRQQTWLTTLPHNDIEEEAWVGIQMQIRSTIKDAREQVGLLEERSMGAYFRLLDGAISRYGNGRTAYRCSSLQHDLATLPSRQSESFGRVDALAACSSVP